ncbi:MAG: T9SS type A sorting domain-containing protein [Bacteroidia bacterium]
MKRNYFSLFGALLIAGLPAKAQSPEITQSNYSAAGDTFTLQMADTTSFSIGNAGSNETWDLSGITLNGTKVFMDATVITGTPYEDDFDAADLAIEEDDVYRYYLLNSGGFTSLGEGYEDGGINILMQHSRPEKLAEFPMEYQDMITTDIVAYTTAQGMSTERKGETTVEADGYGTLRLPGNRNYYDVLRIKVIRNYTDSTNPTGTTPFYTDGVQEIYYWYSETEKGYLARHQRILEVNRSNGNVLRKSTTAGIVPKGSGQVGIAQRAEAAEDFRIMPNPAKDRIMVNFTVKVNQPVKITLYNLLGKSVMQESFTAVTGLQQKALEVSGLPRGVYLLSVESAEGVSTRRVALH